MYALNQSGDENALTGGIYSVTDHGVAKNPRGLYPIPPVCLRAA